MSHPGFFDESTLLFAGPDSESSEPDRDSVDEEPVQVPKEKPTSDATYFVRRVDVPPVVTGAIVGSNNGGNALESSLAAPLTEVGDVQKKFSGAGGRSITHLFIPASTYPDAVFYPLLYVYLMNDLKDGSPPITRDGVELRKLPIHPQYRDVEDDVKTLMEVFMTLTHRSLENLVVRIIFGRGAKEGFKPEEDSFSGLQDAAQSPTFLDIWDEASGVSIVFDLVEPGPSRPWDHKPRTYRSNSLLHFILGQSTLTVDQFQRDLIGPLRKVVRELVIKHIFAGTDMDEYEDHSTIAASATNAITMIKDGGSAPYHHYHLLWTSDAVRKIANIILRKLRIPIVARGLYKASNTLELPFTVLALPSALVIEELLLLKHNTGHHGLRTEPSIKKLELTDDEVGWWAAFCTLLRKLAKDPERDIYLDVAAVVGRISTGANIEACYGMQA